MEPVVLSVAADPDVIHKWNQVQQAHLPHLRAGKKSADEVIAYLQSRYPVVPCTDSIMLDITRCNALAYQHSLGINDPEPESVAFEILNEGTGATLHRTQRQDYVDRIRQIREWHPEAEDVPDDVFPIPIMVGIDRVSGHITVEGSPRLDNELFLFQGLGSQELENPWQVYRHVMLRKQNG